jgi:GT2 family glycosyltransferase
MNLKLSIIIINYNTFEMTCDCLRDIYKSKWNFTFEVILVDNASTERDPNEFKQAFPQIILINSNENGGFARGNNLGIAIAQGEYLLILNSDTLNLEKGVAQCIQYMDVRKLERDLAGVGCRILSPDGSMQRAAFDYRGGLETAFLGNSIIGFIASKFGFGKYRQEAYVIAMHEKEHAVQAMLGAFMLLRRDVIEKVKPLDPDFFMYCEEIEWCYRINDSGYRLMYTPDVSITHIGGGTTVKSIKKDSFNRQYYLSLLLLVFKQHGYLGIFAFNIIFILNCITTFLLLPFRNPLTKQGHKNLLKGTWYSIRHQKIMLKYFTPNFSSSQFPFKASTVEGLSNNNRK